MNEAHVHGFANRLKRTIVIIDARELALVLSAYAPGFAAVRQLSMREAVALRTSSEQQQPIWVLLEPSHFSAVLPRLCGGAPALDAAVSSSSPFGYCWNHPISVLCCHQLDFEFKLFQYTCA